MNPGDDMNQNEPEAFSIEEAGKRLDVSAADIESYVEEGLVTPRQGPGGPVFTRADMRRLWSITTLNRDLGINLPGVAAVLRLREQFEQVRRDLALLAELFERELGPDVWDRLWPEDRPRPATPVSVDGFSDLGGGAEPSAGPGGAAEPDAATDDRPKQDGGGA